MSFEKIRLKILKSQRGQGRGGGLGGLRSGGTVWIAPKGHRSLAKVVERRVSHRPLAPLGQPHPSHLLGAELRFLQFSLWPLHPRWGSETPAATADLTLLLLWVPPFAFLILGAGTSWPPALMGSQVRSQAPPRPLPHLLFPPLPHSRPSPLTSLPPHSEFPSHSSLSSPWPFDSFVPLPPGSLPCCLVCSWVRAFSPSLEIYHDSSCLWVYLTRVCFLHDMMTLPSSEVAPHLAQGWHMADAQ